MASGTCYAQDSLDAPPVPFARPETHLSTNIPSPFLSYFKLPHLHCSGLFSSDMHSPNPARGPKKKMFLARHKPGRFVRHLGTMRQRRKDWRNTRSRTPGTTPVGTTNARTRRFLKDKLPFPRTDARTRARALSKYITESGRAAPQPSPQDHTQHGPREAR